MQKQVQSPLRRLAAENLLGTPERLNAILIENDDESERLERRLSRFLVQLSVQSPRSPFNAIAGMSAAELTDHYDNCMKLSSENKINAKNAFQLQLIDYMAMMLRKNNSELDNFQVASCTLDASTKIYGYRVDNVHSDALKISSVFLRTRRGKKKGGSEDSEEESQEERPKKRRRLSKRSSMIETNLRNLNAKEKDTGHIHIDPFFKRLVTQFNEGEYGTCHFLGHVRFLDDSQECILSSGAPWWRIHQPIVDKPLETVVIPTLDFEALKSAEISPSFASFTFTGWSPENNGYISTVNQSETYSDAERLFGRDEDCAFDMNKMPEPIPMDDSHDDLSDLGGRRSDSPSAREGTVEVMKCTEKRRHSSLRFNSIREILSLDPQEYSYFQKGAKVGWSGPRHWNVKPILRKSPKKVKLKLKPKRKSYLQYGIQVNRCNFERPRRHICLSDHYVNSWGTLNVTLPEDLHLNPASLVRLFLKPTIAIHPKRSKPIQTEEIDQGNISDNNGHEIHLSSFMNEVSIEDIDERILSLPPNALTLKGFDELESGFELVQAPQMEGAAENPQNSEEVIQDFLFSNMYKKLPKELPLEEVASLSIPLAFVALLHLTNEKGLMLRGTTGFSDLTISIGEKSNQGNGTAIVS